jgi:hypothetical protein
MADIKINQDTGELAVPDPSGGYRIYQRGDYKLDSENSRVAIPDGGGFVMFDLPAERGPVFKDPLRSLALGTRQTIEGLATPFTMVGDAANSAVNLGIRGVNALAGTEVPYLMPMSGAVNRALVERGGFPEEANDTERLTGAVIKGGSGALATMGSGAIPAVAKAVPGVASALRINPFSQTVGAMTGSTAAEGTRQGLQDTQLFENPTADATTKALLQLAVGVLGGGAGYLGSRAIANAAQSAKNTAQGILDVATTKGQERIAGQLLREATGDPKSLYARLEDADTASLPGVRPTTAQALGGDTQLSALELALRNDPAYRHAFDIRGAENQTARTQALQSLSPAGAGSVDDLATGIRQAWEQADDAGRQAILAAQQRAQQRIAELGGTIDQQTAGRIIREELEAAYSGARSQTGAAYRAIDPQGTANFAGGEIWQRVAPTIERYFANSTAGTPKELLPIVERLRNSNNLSFAATNAIRKELQDIAGKAAVSGDRTLATAAGEMADGLSGYVDDAAAAGRGFSPEQATQYQAARDLRRDQGQRFERGQVGAVLKKGPYGEPRVSDSGVASELFFRGGGSPEAAQQFIAATGGGPRAVRALQDHIATRLRETVTNADGTIDAGRLAKFQQDHAGALESFPELRNRVASVAEAQSAVDQATLARTARQTEMRGSPLNQFLTKNPADAVDSILMSRNSEAATGKVMNQLRDNPASLAAFKRSVVEWFARKIENAGVQPVSGEPIQSYAKVKSILDNKSGTLGRIFDEGEMKSLRQFADQMATEQRVTSARPMGSNTFSNLASRYLVERMTNSYAPMMGRNGGSALPSFSWLTRAVDERVRDAVTRALLNPADAQRMVGLAKALPNDPASLAFQTLARGLAGQIGLQGVIAQERPRGGPAMVGAVPY